jgi:hypothetical protein
VLKAAQIATLEPGPDATKRIHQRHFVQGMEEVIASQAVMAQSLFDDLGAAPVPGVLERMSEGQEELRAELGLIAERLDDLERRQTRALEKLGAGQSAALEALRAEGGRSRKLWSGVAAALVLAVSGLMLVLIRLWS